MPAFLEDNAMFQHMVRAITDKLGGPSKNNVRGAVNIANSQMRKYGYAKKGKISKVALTDKGKKRSRKHSREKEHKRKSRDYERYIRKMNASTNEVSKVGIRRLLGEMEEYGYGADYDTESPYDDEEWPVGDTGMHGAIPADDDHYDDDFVVDEPGADDYWVDGADDYAGLGEGYEMCSCPTCAGRGKVPRRRANRYGRSHYDKGGEGQGYTIPEWAIDEPIYHRATLDAVGSLKHFGDPEVARQDAMRMAESCDEGSLRAHYERMAHVLANVEPSE